MNQAVWPIPTQIEADFAAKVPGLELYTLENGLRVLLGHDENDRSTFFRMMVNGGALHQSIELRGVPHFTEHMVFRATEEFKDNVAVMDFVQEYNLSFNGFTSQEDQVYYVESDNDLESSTAAAKFISQIVLHPTFPAADADKERDIIMSERKAGMSDPDSVTTEIYTQHFYSDQHPWGGGDVIGTEADIAQYTVEHCRDFYNRFFIPANMLLVATSSLPKEVMKKLIEQHFDFQAPIVNQWTPNPLIGQVRDTERHDSVVNKDFNHVNLYLGNFLQYTDELQPYSLDYFALKLGAQVLSIRQFLEVREKQALAYSTYAYLENMNNGFFFSSHGQFPKEVYAKAKAELLKEHLGLLSRPITETEFRQAKRKLKSVRWADNLRVLATYAGGGLFEKGQLIAPETAHQFYNQLSMESVNATVQKYLNGAELETIAVGPIN